MAPLVVSASSRRLPPNQSFTMGMSPRQPHVMPAGMSKLPQMSQATRLQGESRTLQRSETFPTTAAKSATTARPGYFTARARVQSDHGCINVASKAKPLDKSVSDIVAVSGARHLQPSLDKVAVGGARSPQPSPQAAFRGTRPQAEPPTARSPQPSPQAAFRSTRPQAEPPAGLSGTSIPQPTITLPKRLEMATHAPCSTTSLGVERLTIDEDWIDPCRPSMKGQLLEKLCDGRPAVIERLAGAHGGLNMGVWLLKDGSQTLVLKMVTSTRFMGMPTEAEVLTELARKHPELMRDESIAFPTKIFSCTATDNSRRDLIVMRKAEGECFANVISRKLDNPRQHAGLMADFEAFGAFLAGFHTRYGMQHGDCNPANVIYDEATRRFSLIDVADMGNTRIKHTDVEHFSKGVMSLARRRGQSACDEAKRRFEEGYAAMRNA